MEVTAKFSGYCPFIIVAAIDGTPVPGYLRRVFGSIIDWREPVCQPRSHRLLFYERAGQGSHQLAVVREVNDIDRRFDRFPGCHRIPCVRPVRQAIPEVVATQLTLRERHAGIENKPDSVDKIGFTRSVLAYDHRTATKLEIDLS